MTDEKTVLALAYEWQKKLTAATMLHREYWNYRPHINRPDDKSRKMQAAAEAADREAERVRERLQTYLEAASGIHGERP